MKTTVFTDLPGKGDALLRAPFQTAHLPAGVEVVAEGSAHQALYLLESGDVRVEVDGREVATLGPGAVFGEIGLFTNTVRTATVYASTDVSLRVLEPEGFAVLHDAADPMASWIERRAGSQLLVRFRDLIADLRLSAPAALLRDPASLQPAAGQRVPLPAAAVRAVVEEAFPMAPASALPRLVQLATVRVFRTGQPVATSGRRDASYQIVVDGELDGLAPTEEGDLLVTTLGQGDAFGYLPLIDGRPRPLTYVARCTTTVLTFEPSTVREHLSDDGLGAVLRGPVLSTLAGAVTRTNASILLGELSAAAIGGAASPVSATPAPVQRSFEPLPLDTPIGFGDPDEDWDTWFDVTGGR